MMVRYVRISTIRLGAIFCVLLVLLVILRDDLMAAHIDETIQFVSSDAATYFILYESYLEIDLEDSLDLLLIGSPVLFMKLVAGNLFLILAFNLTLMALALRAAFDCFSTLQGRMAFMAGALLFPYFVFGFLSLNKEVYAMCSAVFFASYMVRGKLVHLLAALLLAACTRYYMIIVLLVLIVLLPREGRPRYRLILALLVAISIAAPHLVSIVPGYSGEGLLENSGVAGKVFSNIVNSYGYALVYPIKYLAQIPMRAYGFLIGSERAGDAMEGVVSIVSFVIMLMGVRAVSQRRPVSLLVTRFVVAAFVAPIPIMWSEIMHWRYYSFVYFFFLFAVVLNFENKHQSLPTRSIAKPHA